MNTFDTQQGYPDLLLTENQAAIQRQSAQEASSASWNYYSTYGGTGVETPALRMALYSIGRRKRRAEDNLAAYYQILKKREGLQSKWDKTFEDLQRWEAENE